MPQTVKSSREKVRHPGPESAQRYHYVRGRVERVKANLPAGLTLIEAVRSALSGFQGGAAFLRIDGLKLSHCNYVLPAQSRDMEHVAWYSDTCSLVAPHALHGTVVVGRKDGEWFGHCHALFKTSDGGQVMGHIFCNEAHIAEDFAAEFLLSSGGGLEVAPDPETNFSLLRPCDQPTHTGLSNAVLLTIRPHEDLRSTLNVVAAETGLRNAAVLGIGSLIGAGFTQGPVMNSDISEILLLPGADLRDGRCTALPTCCVTPDKEIYTGDLLEGHGAILITCEILMVSE